MSGGGVWGLGEGAADDAGERPADRLEGAGAIDDDARGAGDEPVIEVGEDDQIEFQPLRLVDRHHADRRRDRIGDVDGPAVVDEGGGPHQARARTAACHVPFPGRCDELLEAPQIAVRACRADRRGEARKHRAVAVVDERTPEPIERAGAGGRDLPRGAGRVEAEERRERGGGDMEPGCRVGGMVDEVEGREKDLDGR